jgi:hypothetical protein
MSTPVNAPIQGTPYPALSGTPGTTIFSNPPFHPNILNITNSYKAGTNRSVDPPLASGFGYNSGGNLQRGRLITDLAPLTSGAKETHSIIRQVNFLYNPSTIAESRNLDLNNTPLPSQYRVQGDPGAFKVPLNATLGFSLLFDRTFELWDSGYASTDAGKYGVRVDVEAMYNLLGINAPATSTASTGAGTGGAQASANVTVQAGPMSVQPVHLFFGATNQWSLSYYGFITGFDVTWTHFTSAMVPQRCGIDIQFNILPITDSNLLNPVG